jgi:glycosyltransferase involved in cell wall biosynthesis
MEISIIIPHKNSANLLERLLLSIPSSVQSQVIVVDDFSSDTEFSKVQALQKDYSFCLYKNEGKYGGGARNTGLKYATNEWILFADSDDFFLKNAGTVLREYEGALADIVFFRVESCYSDTLEPAYRDKHINLLFDNYIENCDEWLIRCRFTPPWSKLMKRKFIVKNNIRFEECEAGNDNWFSVKSGVLAENIQIAQKPLYCVTVSSGSITKTFSKGKFLSRLYSTLRVNRFLRSKSLGKYQLSILYYIGRSYKFGFVFFLKIICICISNGGNPFIGLSKIFKIRSQVALRESNTIIDK